MPRVTIDGDEYEAPRGSTILQVAREHRIHIPTLCYHEAMEPYGACRLCVVEVEAGGGKKLVTACTYPCSDGLVVESGSEAVHASRRMSVELMLANARRVPLIRDLAAEYGVGEPRFEMPEDDCILCALCVRACRELVGVEAISLVNRGIEKTVSTPFQIASTKCIECGMCVYVCPTGAIQLEHISGRGKAGGDGRGLGAGPTSLRFAVETSFLQDKEIILRPAVREHEAQIGSSA